MILIIGRTGAGKDYLARELANAGLKQVLSYTTRPQRTPDEDTHVFIKPEESAAYKDKIATTVINGYEYFATKQQMKDNQVYIIDPKGMYELLSNCPDITFTVCYLYADDSQRKTKAVGRGADALHEAAVFDKRNTSEDGQFTEFEQVLKNPFKVKEFQATYPNVAGVFDRKNDYNPATIKELADQLLWSEGLMRYAASKGAS